MDLHHDDFGFDGEASRSAKPDFRRSSDRYRAALKAGALVLWRYGRGAC